MLQTIRNASQHWLGKIVMAVIFTLLIGGIAIFGVEEFFRGGASSSVARVGGTEISAEAVRTAYQNQIQRYQTQLKRAITPDQARALGLDRQVLAQLITEAALDQKTHDLGLAIPDATVRSAIEKEEAFKGANGQFDAQTFFQTLQRAGLNEAMFVREQRAVAARLQLAEAVSADLPVPTAMREAVHRYSTERRTAALIVLPPAAAGEIPAPTDDELKGYYEANKAGYRAPETRSLTLLVLDPETMAKPDAISDEDARKAYELNKRNYGAPERRTIQQITFPDEAAAAEARQRIESGEQPFEGVAIARGVEMKDLSLGSLTKAELYDPAVAEAAFALPVGAVSPPVKGRFGTVLLRVTAIEPETVKPFAAVEGEIRKTLALQRAREGLGAAQDAIEDARAGAKPLPEIAQERGLPLVTIPAVDAKGNDAAGRPVEGIPDRDTTLAAAFRSDVGSDTEALRTKSGGAIWYEVAKIEPAHDKPLDEVRAEVATGWKGSEIAKRLQAKSKALTERLEAGETPEAVAGAEGLSLRTASELARNQAKDELPTEVIDRIFATAIDKSASAPLNDGRVVFKVTGATMPAFVAGAPSDVAIEKNFRTALADDVLGEFIADVQKNAGVSVNEAAYRRAIGGEY